MRIKGSDMPLHLQEEAKKRFVHRFTGEHKPAWAYKPFKDEQGNLTSYPVQFRDDQDWLEHTYFELVKDDSLFNTRNRFCESHPTWPFNPELRNTPALPESPERADADQGTTRRRSDEKVPEFRYDNQAGSLGG